MSDGDETNRVPCDLINMTRDQVCDMEVDENSAAGTSEYAGDTYYFCSLECKQKFDEDPENFVSRTDDSQS